MAHKPNSASARIISRLRCHPALARIVGADAMIEGMGAGGDGWSWRIDAGSYWIGSEYGRKELDAAPGLLVAYIGTDQMEVMPDSTPGVTINVSAAVKLGYNPHEDRSALSHHREAQGGGNE